MDSINLSETQRIPLNCRSTASNTSPALCASCGLKNYAQTIPQAYYFRALCPGVSKCKHSQNNTEEIFPKPQQFFAGFPSFFPPFFCNGAIPSNSCCSQNHSNASTISEQQKQPANERDKIPVFPNQQMKSTPEEVKQNNIFGPEEQFLGYPFLISNSPDSHLNPFFRCGCGDSISWPCSPFILPVISYCVFWNSQKSTLGMLSENYMGISSETVYQKNNENPENQEHSSFAADNEICSKNTVNNNSTETAVCKEEQCLSVFTVTRNEWEKGGQLDINQNDPDSLRSPTFSSSNFNTENNFNDAEQMDNNNRNLMNNSDDVRKGKEEDEEENTETYDCTGRERSDECLKLGEKDLPTLPTNLYYSNEPHDTSLNENESQSSTASLSLSDLKESRKNGGSATDISSSDTEANPSDVSGEGEKAFNSRISNPNIQEKNSDNEYERKTPEMKATNFKKPITIKKFIKNFTMTDHTNSVHEEAQNSAEAAGDLGGDKCVGYRVNILKSFEEDQQYKILQETQTEENFQSKAFFKKGLSDLEERRPESYCEKSTVKNSKTPRSFRSGIAKLSNNPKLKESKGDAVKKITNYNNELSQKEPTVTKRKHSCFPDNTAGINDLGSKIQKTRNCGVVQQHNQGTEKQYKATCNSKEPLKKGEKTKADKINSYKLSKIIRKK